MWSRQIRCQLSAGWQNVFCYGSHIPMLSFDITQLVALPVALSLRSLKIFWLADWQAQMYAACQRLVMMQCSGQEKNPMSKLLLPHSLSLVSARNVTQWDEPLLPVLSRCHHTFQGDHSPGTVKIPWHFPPTVWDTPTHAALSTSCIHF